MKLNDLFAYETGNLPALELTEDGNVPLVYGTTRNNGVVKLVKVEDDTKVFNPPLITVSYLGTAFVQIIPFTTSVVDKSNITILVPKKEMGLDELYYYCFQINKIAQFGFNYGRRMNQRQLNKIELIPYNGETIDVKIKERLPKKEKKVAITKKVEYLEFSINKFFEITKGTGQYKENYAKGDTPLVSATTFNNGIIEYVDAKAIFSANTITVERIKGTAFVQFQDYVTVPDDISILLPKEKMSIEELLYFAYLIRKESWRYSYGRKLSLTRLKNFSFKLPVDSTGAVDIKLIKDLCHNCYGWEFINQNSH
ncbi:hypothetical protein DXB28_20650 [Bacillus cereus]|uniref:restriction endonuclease subunit S n=1 Tax=Bacillus paranthracis TaxID=2026186 RepID=UPI0002B8DE52|nr:restriction endonuclease subunit S [Bacillus paranthracis]RGO16721.1 hypothetical protein DXB28_20650 [Bacillus cereus]